MKLASVSSFRRCVKGLADERMAEVLAAMKRAGQAYGHPHLHAGIGLRRLGKHMECRDALDYRLIFASDGDTLVFVFYGTHKEVQAFVKNRT